MKFSDNNWKNNKKARITILFIVILVFAIEGSVIITEKLFTKQIVQAADNSSIGNKDKSSDENNGTKTDSSVNKESDGSVENVAYLEKYIEQQIKGEVPDGVDGKKVAYLTFDDGPSETVTPQILDILKSENVHATFFLIGKYVDKDEASKDLVKREIAEGNAVGIHSYSHDYNYLFPNGKISLENCMADFNKTDEVLKDVLGKDFSTRAIRFPGGQMTWSKTDPQGAQAIDKALHEKDWHQIDWNALCGDAEGGNKDAQALTNEAIKTIGTREKALILMHDTYGKEQTAKALPAIIEYLKKQGYEFKIIK